LSLQKKKGRIGSQLTHLTQTLTIYLTHLLHLTQRQVFRLTLPNPA